MWSFKPALWVTAFVCIYLSLLCAVVKPFELPESPHLSREELGMWVTVDFTTGLEGLPFHNEPNAVPPETALLKDLLETWLRNVLTVSMVLLKDALRVSMVLLTISVVFVLKLIGLAFGVVGVAIFLRRVVWPVLFGMALGVPNWVLKWVASVRDAVVVTLGNYLAHVTQDLRAVKGDFKLKLLRAVGNFPAPMDVLDKILEWVISPKNAGFERLGNPRGTPPKDLDIHFTPISQDHEKSLQPEAATEEVECEGNGVWIEEPGPAIQLNLTLVGKLVLEVVQQVVGAEGVELVMEDHLFRGRPYCRQTIFTANSSKDIEGLPLFIYPRKGRWFYLEMARRVLAKAEALCSRVRSITCSRVSRKPCARASLILRSRRRTKKKVGSAQRVMLLAPGRAVGQFIPEVREETEVFSSCDGEWVDVQVVEEEKAQTSIEPVGDKGKEELGPQNILEKEEVIQQPDQQTMALTTKPENLRAVGLVTELLGDPHSVGVGVVDFWNAEETRPSLKPTISEEDKAAIQPTIMEGSGEPYPQVLTQQEETTQQSDLQATALAHEPGLVTEKSGAALRVDVKVTGPLGMRSTVEEAQVSPGQTTKRKAEAEIEPMVAEGLAEGHPQATLYQEVIRQEDALPAGLAPVPEPIAGINELEANPLAADFDTEPMGDTLSVDANIAGPLDVLVTVEEAGAPPTHTIGECRGEHHPQAFFQPEGVMEQAHQPWSVHVTTEEPLSLPSREVQEASLNELWGYLLAASLITEQDTDVLMAEAPSLDPTYLRTEKSPPSQNFVADLTQYSVPGGGNGESAPMALILGTHEQAPMNSPPMRAVTEGTDVVESMGRVMPAFLFGDAYATAQDSTTPPSPPRVVNSFDFGPPGQQRLGPVATPSTAGIGFVFGSTREFLPAKAPPSPEEYSDSNIIESWDSEFAKLLEWEEPQTEGEPNQDEQDSNKEEDEEDSTREEDEDFTSEEDEEDSTREEDKQDSIKESEEEGGGDDTKARGAATMSTHSSTPVFLRSGFLSRAEGNEESNFDQIKWADSMPAHFHTRDYAPVNILSKVEKDTEESRGESKGKGRGKCDYSRAELATSSRLLQPANPKFAGNGPLQKEEEGGGKEQSVESGELSNREMSKGNHEVQDKRGGRDGDGDGDGIQ